jgi:two-component system OmpR family sensor kinase
MAVPARGLGRVGAVRRAVDEVSLRTRLVLGIVVVVLVGLIAANVIVFETINNYLIRSVDDQLAAAEPAVLLANQHGGGEVQLNANTPAGTYAAIYTASGQAVDTLPSFTGPIPALSKSTIASLSAEAASASNSNGVAFRTLGSVGNQAFQYRLLVAPITVSNLFTGASMTGVAIVAIPLQEMNATLHTLIVIDLDVGALLLVVLGFLGYVVVRLGLRPLVDIERTAGAIAAGDLSQRVDREEETTEVGRLGASLNVMLGTIEHSFNEQVASENRLRQFLADASHELRTPVTSIRGYAELFRRGAAERPDDLALAMRRIEDESVRMGSLVDDLLLLARLDQGRPLEENPVDLAVIAADGVADAEIFAPGRKINLDVEGPLMVLGDEQRLRQVVANLLQNAIRYTADDVEISVVAQRSDETISLSVIDAGEGIDPEHLARLFERFYRADPSRTRGSGGSGLGLAIVASIAEAHGGSVAATSELGRGTTFTVTLPLLESRALSPTNSFEPYLD